MDSPFAKYKEMSMQASSGDNEYSVLGRNIVVLHPPAKINMSLVVFGLRSDGFHDLHTIMATVELYDDLCIQLADKAGIKLHCDGRGSPSGPENLVYRAAELFSQYAQVTPALEIYLHKHIPVGGGLGGASSDAAACLIGLNQLWQLGMEREELAQLAQQLGSDVPFFLYAPVALCTGRGEIVKAIQQRCERKILLIMPDIFSSTKEVYQNYVYDSRLCGDDLQCIQYFLRHGDLESLVAQGVNSLTDTVMKIFAPLSDLRDRLSSLGIGPVYMSGSGSCLFVTSDSRQQLSTWSDMIQKDNLAETKIVAFQNQTQLYPEVHHADL